MNQDRREQIHQRLERARRKTEELFNLVADESLLHRSPGFGYRPILWHLAHIGTFEEFWLARRIGNASAINERYSRLFDPISTPREKSDDLPSRREMEDFLQEVRAASLRVLEDFDFDNDDPLRQDGYVFDLVLQHELQHQETLAYLLHLLPVEAKFQISNSRFQIPDQTAQNENSLLTEGQRTKDKGQNSTVEFSAADVCIGAMWNEFAYDNELPAHTVHVPAFRLDRFLTTNAEFAEFVAENGYRRRELWSAEGWTWRERENIEQPLNWHRRTEGWTIKTMFAELPFETLRTHPVSGVNFYEAEAYAEYRGKRLPTEFEWERAASWNAKHQSKRKYAFGNTEPTSERANFDFEFWNTTPVSYFANGATPAGCFDLSGNLWEWTSSTFAPYPNFRAFPYEEYSAMWFDGDHRVLRGGSWATSAEMLRTSFRNFFRPNFRIAFAGIRLAINV